MMKIIDDHECLTFTRQLLADLPLAMTNNKTIIPKVTKALAWRYFSDNVNGETVRCQLCKPRDVNVKVCTSISLNHKLIQLSNIWY